MLAAAHNEVISALYADLGEVLRTELRLTVGPVLEEQRYVSDDGILRPSGPATARRPQWRPWSR